MTTWPDGFQGGQFQVLPKIPYLAIRSAGMGSPRNCGQRIFNEWSFSGVGSNWDSRREKGKRNGEDSNMKQRRKWFCCFRFLVSLMIQCLVLGLGLNWTDYSMPCRDTVRAHCAAWSIIPEWSFRIFSIVCQLSRNFGRIRNPCPADRCWFCDCRTPSGRMRETWPAKRQCTGYILQLQLDLCLY